MSERAAELESPTYAWPGVGGSLGKCVVCGRDFLKEILMGENIATLSCNWFAEKSFPCHKACADKIENIHLATELPPGPLRTIWYAGQQPERPR